MESPTSLLVGSRSAVGPRPRPAWPRAAATAFPSGVPERPLPLSTEDEMAPSFVGVGVGPGDPDLMTTRALRTLRGADRVFAPAMSADVEGRAESTVRQAVPDVAVERLVFAIGDDDDARDLAHDHAATRIVECLDAGEQVAFVTLGDPNIYSTFHHLAALVAGRRAETEVGTVPGIMAFQELAACAGVVVTDGVERLAVVSAVDGAEGIADAIAAPATAIVVYKGGRHVPEIAARLERAGRLEGAVLGELLGLPGERVGPLAELGQAPASYLATVIVPPAARS